VFVTSDEKKLGQSGVFKAIVESARKIKRALSESDVEELPETASEIGTRIAQAFVAGRFADVHAMGTTFFRERNARTRFEDNWRDAVAERGPLTGFEVNNAGQIDLQYIPGLEDVPQEAFVAFVEIAFSTPEIPLEHDKAFAIGAVLLDDGGDVRLGAIHAR
jgi:hypothetical protein